MAETARWKLADWIASMRITATAQRADANPNMEDGAHIMDHWRVTLRCGGSRMTVPFSMGQGHNGQPPTAADVLECLALDASSYENARSFEDWCAEYGYDTDSRKAERTYRAVKRGAERLERWLGNAYQTLLWEVDAA